MGGSHSTFLMPTWYSIKRMVIGAKSAANGVLMWAHATSTDHSSTPTQVVNDSRCQTSQLTGTTQRRRKTR